MNDKALEPHIVEYNRKMLDQFQQLQVVIDQGDTLTAKRLVNKLVSDALPEMSIEEIKTQTKSTGATSRSCVYEAIEEAVMVIDPDGDRQTLNDMLEDLPKGTKMIISGCGEQSKTGMSYYLWGDTWVLVSNASMKHVANPILVKAPADHPTVRNERT